MNLLQFTDAFRAELNRAILSGAVDNSHTYETAKIRTIHARFVELEQHIEVMRMKLQKLEGDILNEK